MKGIIPKYMVIIGCAAAVLLTLLTRSQIYERQAPEATASAQPADEFPQANEVIIHFHTRRPFYMSDGNRVFGLVADPIARAFEAAGIPHIWKETPARRQLSIIERNEDKSCAAGWFKTPEREAYARYTLPIYQDKPFVAITRTDNEYLTETETTLDQILKEWRLKILVKEGYSYGQFIDERLKVFAPRQITTTAENWNILKMIENYRADYSFMTEEEAQDLLVSLKVNAAKFKIVRLTDIPSGDRRYIICSKKVDADIIDRLDAAIRSRQPIEVDR